MLTFGQKILFVSFFLFFKCIHSLAQEKTKNVLVFNVLKFKNIKYTIAYNGNSIWFPGIKYGIESLLYQKKILKYKKNGKVKNRRQEILPSVHSGFYWDPESYTGTYLAAGLIFKKVENSNFYYSFNIHPIACQINFLPETYEVSEAGEVEKVFLPNRTYYAPNFGIGFGQEIDKKFIKEYYLNINSSVLYPYNAFFSLLFFLEIGIKFEPF